ncbi:MAG: ribosome recycling factor [Pseudonocardiales bacterium]|nr:ribosome recycling factor [Pseudonocardiales bacterium]
MIDETLFEAEEKMEKAVSVLHNDLGALRTGRASASSFNRIAIDYYGAMTPLPQLASVAIPEARMAVIKPYDASQLNALEKAIRGSDLGVNPSNDGNLIRVVFPQLTEERRREFVKLAKSRGEDAKVSIRSVRRHANETFGKLVKDGEVGEDDARRAEADLQKLTDKYVAQVDESVRVKEAELLEV